MSKLTRFEEHLDAFKRKVIERSWNASCTIDGIAIGHIIYSLERSDLNSEMLKQAYVDLYYMARFNQSNLNQLKNTHPIKYLYVARIDSEIAAYNLYSPTGWMLPTPNIVNKEVWSSNRLDFDCVDIMMELDAFYDGKEVEEGEVSIETNRYHLKLNISVPGPKLISEFLMENPHYAQDVVTGEPLFKRTRYFAIDLLEIKTKEEN